MRARDKDVERLQRALDSTLMAEAGLSATAAQADEAARKLDTDLSGIKAQMMQMVGQVCGGGAPTCQGSGRR